MAAKVTSQHPMDILVGWRSKIPRPDPIAMLDEWAPCNWIAELESMAAHVPVVVASDHPLTDVWRVLWAFSDWVQEQWKNASSPSLDCLVLATLWTQTELHRLGGREMHAALSRLEQPVAPSLVVAARDFLGTARAATQYAELRLEIAVTTRSGHAEQIQLWTVADGLTVPLALRIAAEQLALARQKQAFDPGLFLSASLAALCEWRHDKP